MTYRAIHKGSYENFIQDGFLNTHMETQQAEFISKMRPGEIKRRKYFSYESMAGPPRKTYNIWVLKLPKKEVRFFNKNSEAKAMRMLHMEA